MIDMRSFKVANHHIGHKSAALVAVVLRARYLDRLRKAEIRHLPFCRSPLLGVVFCLGGPALGIRQKKATRHERTCIMCLAIKRFMIKPYIIWFPGLVWFRKRFNQKAACETWLGAVEVKARDKQWLSPWQRQIVRPPMLQTTPTPTYRSSPEISFPAYISSIAESSEVVMMASINLHRSDHSSAPAKLILFLPSNFKAVQGSCSTPRRPCVSNIHSIFCCFPVLIFLSVRQRYHLPELWPRCQSLGTYCHLCDA